MTRPDLALRARGAILGTYIGDALAMPVHWYYDRIALREDYGVVTDYLAPKNPHADSILWRSRYDAPNERGEILHEQKRYWGQRGVHYHQFLKAGENTLNLKLCTLLLESLNETGSYDRIDWLDRYIAFMTTPGNHRDTYVEEYHREFFANYAMGRAPTDCAVTEKHIGGLVMVAPLVVFHRHDPKAARQAAKAHVSLTHRGPRMEAAVDLLVDILLPVLAGAGLRETIESLLDRGESSLLAHPFRDWIAESDLQVVGRRLSPACYVEDSVPAVIYFALKYHDAPEAALVANTMAGGDNAYRGAVLGALLGAGNGAEGFPMRWRQGLKSPPPEIR